MVYMLIVTSTEHYDSSCQLAEKKKEKLQKQSAEVSKMKTAMQGFLATCKTSSTTSTSTLGLVESLDSANLSETRDEFQGYDSDRDQEIDSVLPM